MCCYSMSRERRIKLFDKLHIVDLIVFGILTIWLQVFLAFSSKGFLFVYVFLYEWSGRWSNVSQLLFYCAYFNSINCSSFLYILKSCLGEFKCLQPRISLESLMSFLWLCRLMCNSVSDFRILFCKFNIRVNKWHICFSNLISGKYKIFYWYGRL